MSYLRPSLAWTRMGWGLTWVDGQRVEYGKSWWRGPPRDGPGRRVTAGLEGAGRPLIENGWGEGPCALAPRPPRDVGECYGGGPESPRRLGAVRGRGGTFGEKL
jgi:hypothetical protein